MAASVQQARQKRTNSKTQGTAPNNGPWSGDEPWWPSRYDAGDQLGSLNEITPEQVVAAARLVRRGAVYDLGRTLDSDVPHFPGRFWQQTLVSSAHLANPRREGGQDGGWGHNQVNWLIELATGTFQIGTQLDGGSHRAGRGGVTAALRPWTMEHARPLAATTA